MRSRSPCSWRKPVIKFLNAVAAVEWERFEVSDGAACMWKKSNLLFFSQNRSNELYESATNVYRRYNVMG